MDDLKHWKKSGQKQLHARILILLQSIQATPFDGIGKPESLKHNLAGMWSRRINYEHTIIYEVKSDEIHIFSLRDHY